MGSASCSREAAGPDVDRIVVGLGGSATNDAGAGLLAALGATCTGGSLDEGPAGARGDPRGRPRCGPGRCRRGRARAGQRRGQPAARHQRRHQDLRPAEGAGRGAAGHGRRLAAALRRGDRPQGGRRQGRRRGRRAGLRADAAGRRPASRASTWSPTRWAWRTSWARPTSPSRGRGPSTSPRARARCPTAWPSSRRAHLVPCIALAGQVLIGSREMRALGVESAYSMVDLVGEERALGSRRRRWPTSPSGLRAPGRAESLTCPGP